MTESSGFNREEDLIDIRSIPLTNAINDASVSQNSITLAPGMTLRYTLEGHQDRVESLAWSPDGKLLASGSRDGTVRLWDPTDGRLLHTLEGHQGPVESLAWSPDGKLLASGSGDKTVRLWDPTDGRLLHTLEGHQHWVEFVVWSPDGKLLASGSGDGTVRLWDPADGILLYTLEGHQGPVESLAWSPDGKLLASGSRDGTVRLWDPTDGRLLHTLEGHKGRLNSMNGKQLRIRTIKNSIERHKNTVGYLAWSPDGKLLASGSADTVRLWDPTDGRLLHTLEGHQSIVGYLAWSPDGKLLVSGSLDLSPYYPPEIYIWQVGTWESCAVLTGLTGDCSITWHPHLSAMATARLQFNDLFIWHLDLERLLCAAPSPEMVHYSNAKVLLVGDSGIGKSGLALVLTSQPFTPTDSTHGRHVWLVDQKEVQMNDKPHEMREIWLWDLAGQRDYRLIHQLHLHEATVALIVFDAARDTNPFAGIRHWHRALRLAQQARGSIAQPLIIFLVAARIDRGGRSVSYARIDGLVQELGCAGYFETSAKDGRGIINLNRAIHTAIDWTRLPKVTSTKLLHAIKTFVLSEQQTGQLLRTPDDLYDTFLCSPYVPALSDKLSQQFETALGRLETQGDIHSLHFGNLILLQPERLDAYASALLIAVKNEPDELGSIPEVRVLQGDFLVPEEDRLSTLIQEKLLLIAMIDELVRHELVLRESGSLLFPSQSLREHPDTAALATRQMVTFTFVGPVLSIYTTLVVRLAQCGVFQKQDLWQHVVTYTTRLGGTYGLLLSPQGEDRAELGFFFDEAAREEMCFHFEDFVRTHLERHSSVALQRRRHFVCPECRKVFSETDVIYRQTHGFTFITCVCDTKVSLLDGEERLDAASASSIREIELAADVERDRESAVTIRQGKIVLQETNRLQLQNAEKVTQNINVYISSASTPEDEMLLNELETQLSMLQRQQPNMHLWEKRLIPPGANWEQEISMYVDEANLILFLVSPDLLASEQCYEEMEWAMKRREANNISVIPLLMRFADWQNAPISQLEPLPTDRKPVRDRKDRERAMYDIAQHIRHAIEKICRDLTNKGS